LATGLGCVDAAWVPNAWYACPQVCPLPRPVVTEEDGGTNSEAIPYGQQHGTEVQWQKLWEAQVRVAHGGVLAAAAVGWHEQQ
jgi:hypothetical protein